MSATPGVPFIPSMKAPANITVNTELSSVSSVLRAGIRLVLFLPLIPPINTDLDMLRQLMSFRPERSGVEKSLLQIKVYIFTIH